MEKNSVLHVRINDEDKKLAEEIYSNLGTSLSEATRVFVKQTIHYHGFPFRLSCTEGKGKLSAEGVLNAYAGKAVRDLEREAWIRALSNKYEYSD